jgi:hypothetical protein
MNWLVDWVLGPFFAWCKWFGLTAWDLWRKWETFKWKIVALCIGVVWLVITNAAKWIAQTVAMLDTLIFPTKNLAAPGSLSWVLALCNTLFPLSELMGLVLAYYTFVIGFGIYRFIKSWIPAVSGNA